MPSSKHLVTWGVAGAIETNYGEDALEVDYSNIVTAPDTFAAHGLFTETRPSFQYEYITDGERGPAPATGSQSPSSGSAGRKGMFEYESVFLGSDVDWTTSIFPDFDPFLRSAGLKRTFIPAGTGAIAGAGSATDSSIDMDGLGSLTSIAAGSSFTIAGNTQVYTVIGGPHTVASNAVTGLTFKPDLVVDAADNAVVTLLSSLVYGLTNSGFESGSYYIFERQQVYKLTGAYAENIGISFDGPVSPMFTSSIMGIAQLPDDAVLPALLYPDIGIVPPKAVDTSLRFIIPVGGTDVIIGKDLVLRSCTIDVGRTLGERPNANQAEGFAGYTPGRREPTMEFVIESTSLSTALAGASSAGVDEFNPYIMRDEGTVFNTNFQVGSEANNRFKLDAPNAQITSVDESEDGPTATWTLQMALRGESYSEGNEFTLTFD